MAEDKKLEFDKDKNGGQNINLFLNYLKKKNNPWSKILKNALQQDTSEEEFRRIIKADVLALLNKDKSNE